MEGGEGGGLGWVHGVAEHPCQSEAGHPESLTEGGHPAHTFAHEGRGVDAAFAADDEVGGLDAVGEASGGGEEIEAGLEVGAKEGEEAEAESARGAGAWDGGQVLAGMLLPAGGQTFEARFRVGEVLWADPLLGAVDAGGALGPEQRVADVHRHGDVGERVGRGGRFEVVEAMEVGPAG